MAARVLPAVLMCALGAVVVASWLLLRDREARVVADLREELAQEWADWQLCVVGPPLAPDEAVEDRLGALRLTSLTPGPSGWPRRCQVHQDAMLQTVRLLSRRRSLPAHHAEPLEEIEASMWSGHADGTPYRPADLYSAFEALQLEPRAPSPGVVPAPPAPEGLLPERAVRPFAWGDGLHVGRAPDAVTLALRGVGRVVVCRIAPEGERSVARCRRVPDSLGAHAPDLGDTAAGAWPVFEGGHPNGLHLPTGWNRATRVSSDAPASARLGYGVPRGAIVVETHRGGRRHVARVQRVAGDGVDWTLARPLPLDPTARDLALVAGFLTGVRSTPEGPVLWAAPLPSGPNDPSPWVDVGPVGASHTVTGGCAGPDTVVLTLDASHDEQRVLVAIHHEGRWTLASAPMPYGGRMDVGCGDGRATLTRVVERDDGARHLVQARCGGAACETRERSLQRLPSQSGEIVAATLGDRTAVAYFGEQGEPRLRIGDFEALDEAEDRAMHAPSSWGTHALYDCVLLRGGEHLYLIGGRFGGGGVVALRIDADGGVTAVDPA